jgi:D-alanyl-lipoteichoic acid acyltransferase DltB (MBOAT superfamily)
MKVMLWGFFLKMVVADRLAMFVDKIYNNVGDYTGWPLIVATYFFAFQIYCDFAGYSFIAIGGAQVLGFNLMDNFRRPYFSKSIKEFWRRWHISLSTWFRDYIYIPLGGNRVKKAKVLRNVIIVFFITGLWHGAGWTYVIWGMLHGVYMLIGSLTTNIREKALEYIGIIKSSRIHKAFQLIITFHLVAFGWIFFRANTISDAFYIIKNLFVSSSLTFNKVFILSERREFVVAILAILFMEFIHLIQERVRIRQFLDDKPIVLRWVLYYAIIFAILIFGVYEEVPFIYFQF